MCIIVLLQYMLEAPLECIRLPRERKKTALLPVWAAVSHFRFLRGEIETGARERGIHTAGWVYYIHFRSHFH